jgi:16S rRNA (cytosine967-C5)-methyltransferase
LLRLAVAECLYREKDKHPQIVNTAVEMGRLLGLSKPETGFVNGVLRSILREPEALDYSLDETHPSWMVARWRARFGGEALALLLEWNFSTPELTIRSQSCPEYAEPTRWDSYFRILPGRFKEALPDLEAGRVYVQDPFTRIPVELLNVQAGELVMDLCAAPGGKSRMLFDCLGESGHMVVVDRPGPRLTRLKENLKKPGGEKVSIVGTDVLELESRHLPDNFSEGQVDAVLIDVPCSNTGVIQKRPDVKLRLKKENIAQQAAVQQQLLQSAAKWVRCGGRLVYSTCSLEEEENEGIVISFLGQNPEWHLEETVLSLPWMCGHDGGGAFLLTKSAQG